jgi:3-hydroxyisobutyrate dehydrogenase
MGTRMAGRLIAAGHDVVVWNRTPSSTEPLVQAGARAAEGPAAAVADAELVITMLTGPEAVTEVLTAALPGLRDGAVVVEMSTIGPTAVLGLRELLPGGVGLVDAPVKGSLPAAEKGELGIYAGGSDADYQACQAVLTELGKPQHLGPLGTGAQVKLVVNVALGSAFVLVAEAIQLADKLGLDTELALTALEGTAVSSLMPRVRAKLDDPGATQFALGLAEKDLRLVLEEGVVGDGVVAGARTQLAGAMAAGLGDADISSILGHLRAGKPA